MRRVIIALALAASLIPALSGCYTMGYYTSRAVHTFIPPGPPPEPVYAPAQTYGNDPGPQVESVPVPPVEQVPPSAPEEGTPAAPDDSGGY